MATYSFKNRKTGKIKEYQIPMSEYDQFKADHPELERIIEAAGLAFRGRGDKTVTELAVKRDKGWGEVLAKIGEQNPHSDLNANYTKNKTHKKLKAEAIVEKHAKIQAEQAKRWQRR